MATSPPKSNEPYTSTYYNQNQCFSFSRHVPTSIVQLSGQDPNAPEPWGTNTNTAPAVAVKVGQPCSEVVIYNTTGGALEIYVDTSGNYGTVRADHVIKIHNNHETTVRGLTNVNQVSAKAGTAGLVHYRTQFYSSNPVR
jgi:hypothetical protein|tara:strand:+ start:1682 stop:2101 length:420 start_codon:yes stop_codon:yes gene_type:complete